MVANAPRRRYSQPMIENEDATLAELTRALVERFAPERIVLFGSRARGDHHPESDYDLLGVLDQPDYTEDVVRRAVQDLLTDVGALEYVVDHEGRSLYSRTDARKPGQVRESPHEPPASLQEWVARAQSD